MQHPDIRRALAERLQALLESQERLPIKPRPYQSETLGRTAQWLEDFGGTRRGYVSQATGLGKTWLFSAMVSHCTGLRTLIVVPTKVLIEQTARFVVQFTGGLIGHLSGLKQIRRADGEVVAVRGHEHSDVVITTDESFIKHAGKIASEFGPHLIVWDECHWGYTAEAQRALAAFPEAVVIGFSATPDYLGTAARGGFVPVTLDNRQVLYGDPQRLAATHFGTLIDERTVRWGIENQWLAPFAWGMLECNIALDQLPTALTGAGMDYSENALQTLMSRHWSTIVEVVRRLYADAQYTLAQRQVFAVCPSVKTAEALAKAIHESGVRSACITAATSDTERNVVLASYATGEIKFLTSVMVLREGWDAPNAEVCLMLRPTKSRVLYLQSMGRVLRPAANGGRKVALVVDAFSQSEKFSALSAPVLFGEPGKSVRERAILLGPKLPTADAPEETSPYLPEGVQPRLVFVHPLQIEYWVGKDDILELDGETWALAGVLGRLFKLDPNTVRSRLARAQVRTKEMRGGRSQINTFYCVSDARQACADLLRFPRAGAKGMFRADSRLWASPPALYSWFGIKRARVIEGRIKTHKIRPRKGRDRSGRVADFYSVVAVRKICGDLVEASRVGLTHHGILKVRGMLWVSRSGLIPLLKADAHTIAAYLQSPMVRRLQARNRAGRVVTVYALRDVRKLRHSMQKGTSRDKVSVEKET
ncbi:DEAD/DEAH box helicase [Candidatus Uhrbacteria bacterium]|nr:DEAD/DEAH box helicase [Candidatus Uhrbacteria bacterium]